MKIESLFGSIERGAAHEQVIVKFGRCVCGFGEM